MNAVETHREKMKTLQASGQAVVISKKDVSSPCGKYHLALTELTHEQNGHTRYYWVVVTRQETGAPVVDFFTDSDDEFYGWVTSQGRDYLLFAELEGGQTVVDLQDGRLSSFYDADDEFIWTDFHLSPSGLAVGGCFWACPWDVRVYDFSRPIGEPLPVLKRFECTDTNLQFEEWLDDNRFILSDEKGRDLFEISASAE